MIEDDVLCDLTRGRTPYSGSAGVSYENPEYTDEFLWGYCGDLGPNDEEVESTTALE